MRPPPKNEEKKTAKTQKDERKSAQKNQKIDRSLIQRQSLSFERGLMSLRIIGGKFKNRLLKSPKSIHTRPTQSLVRKAFFDICMQEVPGCHFLDLYAGSGAMGIEALSRGATTATFIDSNKQAIWTLKENLELFHLEESTTVLMKEAIAGLKIVKNQEQLFDLIYIDPPYDQDPFPILQFLDENQLLAKDGSIFLEERLPSKIGAHKAAFSHLHWIQERKFGKTVLNQFILN